MNSCPFHLGHLGMSTPKIPLEQLRPGDPTKPGGAAQRAGRMAPAKSPTPPSTSGITSPRAHHRNRGATARTHMSSRARRRSAAAASDHVAQGALHLVGVEPGLRARVRQAAARNTVTRIATHRWPCSAGNRSRDRCLQGRRRLVAMMWRASRTFQSSRVGSSARGSFFRCPRGPFSCDRQQIPINAVRPPIPVDHSSAPWQLHRLLLFAAPLSIGVALELRRRELQRGEPIAQDLVLLRQLLRTKVESDALGARVANRCHRTFGSRMGSVEDAVRQRERTENQGEEREEERRSLRPEG